MTLHLCWSSPAQCPHLFLVRLLWNPPSWASPLEVGGLLGAPTSVRGHPAAEAKAKVKTRLKLVKHRLHKQRLFTRSLRWEPPQLSLWLESVAVRLFCSKKLRMERGWSKTSLRLNRTGKYLRGKPTGWTAPRSAQNPPV